MNDQILLVMSNRNTTKNFYNWKCPWDIKKKLRPIHSSKINMLMMSQCAGIVVCDEESLKKVISGFSHIELWVGPKPSYNSLVGKFNFGFPKIVNEKHTSVPVLCAPSFKQMYIRHFQVMYVNMMHKFIKGNKYFLPKYSFDYKFCDYAGLNQEIQTGEGVKPCFIAIDTETLQQVDVKNLRTNKTHTFDGVIDLVSISAVYYKNSGVKDLNNFYIKTWVMPWKKIDHWRNLKEVCASDSPKVMHNKNYDMEYFLRWRCPIKNVVWDSQNYMRSVTSSFVGFYSLHAVHSMSCKVSVYWKDLADVKHGEGTDSHTGKKLSNYYRYSGLDSHNTAEACLNQMVKFNKINFNNFCSKLAYFPFAFKASLCSMKINSSIRDDFRMQYTKKFEDSNNFTNKITGHNASQSKPLLPSLVSLSEVAKKMKLKDVPIVKSTDAKILESLSTLHPIYTKICESIIDARSATNFLSTFINFTPHRNFGDDDTNDYFRWALDPFIVGSMRLASKASNLWCGTNAQNIPPAIRHMMEPPEGYVFAGIDAPQSESYTTGYLADCPAMIKVLLDPEIDFHKYSASTIFEQPYDEITKEYRTLAKPSGFGFNYGMEAYGLLFTMGLIKARALRDALGFDADTSLVRVCAYAIRKISERYPEVRGRWYMEQLMKVIRTGRLYCVGGFAPVITEDPLSSGNALNSIVSMESQHLSVKLNLDGCNQVLWNELKGTSHGIKTILQVHDELVVIVPENLPIEVSDKFLQDCFYNETEMPSGKTMSIPAGIPVYGHTWGDLKHDELDRSKLDITQPVKSITPKGLGEVNG